MQLPLVLRRRLRWLNVPTLSLLALLQRTPVQQLAATAEELVASSPLGAVLRSVVTVAALGALHSRAGATELVTNQPSPLQATVGTPIQTVAFGLIGTDTPPSSWQINGTLPPGLNIDGRTSLGLFITGNPQLGGTPTTAGTYEIDLSGSDQGFQSPTFSYVIVVKAGTVAAPAFTTQPQSQTVNAGANVTFTAAASGSPTYQWRKDGNAIGGATNATLTLTSVTSANAGTYSVVATNSGGSATSNNAVLTVNSGVAGPVITTQPLSQTIAPGGAASFTVAATGSGLSYQWRKNGAAIGGATATSLNLSNLQGGDAADYTVAVTNAGGTTVSRFARLVVAAPDPGRIANLSVRAQTGVAGQSLTVGFIMSGGSKSLLIRASGPALGALGVPGTIPDPALQVHQKINGQDTIVASNDNWSTNANAAAIAAVPGPFPFPAGGKDAALLLDVDSDRTALVNDVTGVVGVTLVEVYDVGTGNSPRLVNVSTLNFSGTGDNVLIAGFIISGNVPKTLLIRGVGPTLSSFGVGGLLADPVMEIHGKDLNNQDILVATNDNWQDDPNAAAAAAIPGPFALNAGSKDAALLITLPAGAYTVQVSGANQTTGNALIEVYDIQ
ncbi:MAG TPA: immunoglobulin domain-containing protein [Opitutaceae bacterium]|nr:immunoglobulin domain-containing protein [Opitutaceae bacterium]